MAKIKNILVQDRPREKLLNKGVSSLSEIELLQVIIGSGVKGADVTKISRMIAQLLGKHQGKTDIESLLHIKGISTATASKILASLELAERYRIDGLKVNLPEDVLPMLHDIREKKQEHFVVFSLDGANRIITRRIVSIGTLSASLVHPREVFADVITDRAASIIIAHNHPGGSLEPSKADTEVTERIKNAGAILGIRLLDHIIVTDSSYAVISKID